MSINRLSAQNIILVSITSLVQLVNAIYYILLLVVMVTTLECGEIMNHSSWLPWAVVSSSHRSSARVIRNGQVSGWVIR
jgi:hypothetical protein